LKRFLQKRSKICIALAQKGVEICLDGVSVRQHLIARQTSEARLFCAFPAPTPVAREITESSLKPIVISAAS
jgi:hypothetical protein